MASPWRLGVCLHWIGAERRYCRSVESVRAFLTGPCCPLHTPAALAGRPEAPKTDSIRPSELPVSPLSTSGIADARAVSSGKRRAKNPAEYRAAQAAVAKTN